MRFLKSNTETFAKVLTKYFTFKNESQSIDILYEVWHSIKREDFEIVLDFLKEKPEIAENLGYYLRSLFSGKPFNLSLTEANILSENAFFPELKKRLLDKVLPPVDNECSIWYLIDYVSVRPGKDLEYLRQISETDLDECFELLGISKFIALKNVREELLFSANILAWRAIGNALDIGVMNMVPEYKNYDNPFLALQDELDLLNREYRKDENYQLTSKDLHYKQIKIYLEQCLTFVDTAFKNSSKYGISGKINQSLLKIKQQIKRILDIIHLLILDKEEDKVSKSKKLIFNILEYKSHKNNITELFNDSTRLMSHLITNHTAETGSHYISSTQKEYMKMFWKASGGGVVVGALCILKMMYAYPAGSEFSHAFMYAFNYAMGFIMIYLMGFTLATKQPAMTAATMAKVLSDEVNTRKNYQDFALFVSRLFRTQFVAFIGNVLWAFPVSLALIYSLDVLFNYNFAAEKSTVLLKDLNPFESKALFHASIAGFYLFISGIISGNIGNNSVFYNIPNRIAKNPMLKNIVGEKTAQSLSKYYEKNWAGIASNFWFGVFLGVTGTIGKFIGIDIDIRHITFAAGNFAIGLYGKGFDVELSLFWICLITVFLIGLFNFLVSFGLSMGLALRSRKISFDEVGEILKEIFRFFIKNPMSFFFPVRSPEVVKRAEEMKVNKTNQSEGH